MTRALDGPKVLPRKLPIGCMRKPLPTPEIRVAAVPGRGQDEAYGDMARFMGHEVIGRMDYDEQETGQYRGRDRAPVFRVVPVLHKKLWWNSLIGNPNGYLDDDHPVEAIYFELQSMEFLSFGPGWIRGWEFSYFVLLIIVSLVIKFAFRIH